MDDLVMKMAARARILAESRWLLLVAALMVMGTGCWLTLWLRPQPHSDWGYYWAAAGSPDRYERGGVGLWLLAAPKMAGLSPMASALLLNTLSVAAFALLLWRLDRTRWRLPTWLTMAYLLLLAPYLGIVQLDLVAAALVACGVCMAACGRPSVTRVLAGTALVAGGVSTKPQYALVLWAMVALATPLLLARQRDPRRGLILGILLAGSILGFALDDALRRVGGRTEAIRTNSAVTLYGGLLVSGTGPGCGYWSPDAANAARADLDEPLRSAIFRRLAEKPASHWVAVIRCKLPEILRPPPYALYWLVESPNVRQWLDARPDHLRLEQVYQRALWLERKAYGWVTWALMAMMLAICALQHRRNAPPLARWLPILWVLAFWLVHAVFEIQGRYFLGMYLLLPAFCLLAWAPGSLGRGVAAD